jgi:hypothetical protein
VSTRRTDIISFGYRRTVSERASDVREYFEEHPEWRDTDVLFTWLHHRSSDGREVVYATERVPRCVRADA